MYKIDLEKSPRVKKLLQLQVGDKTDLSQFAVFELRANDTLPITKAGGILLNARMTESYLSQMAQTITKGSYVPVIQMHQADNSLPVGRILDAKVYDNETDFNQKDLHVLIYMKAELPETNKIDAGIINEVSTGTSPDSIKCSACDFDFYASPENKRKLWDGKGYTPLCDNGHQWGMNGNHLRLAGMKHFRELSVVTRGAAPTAQVIKAENARLAAETSEINLSAYFNADILLSTVQGASFSGFEKPKDFVSLTPNSSMGEKMGDISLAQEKYDTLLKDQAKVEHLTAELAAANEKLGLANTAKTTAETDKATVEASLTAETEKVNSLTTERDDLQAKLTAADAKIAIYVAGGKPDHDGLGVGANANLQAEPTQATVLDSSFYKAAK